MKRLWLSAGFLAVLLAGAFYNVHQVESITTSIVRLLNDAEEAALHEDWDRVERLTLEAKREWEAAEDYFSVVLVHAETDEVSTGFEEVMGFMEYHAAPEYDSSNGTLVAKVEHLADVEAVDWKNIL